MTLIFSAISFPCNDAIGHVYGPDSQEVLDVTLRSDLVVRELLSAGSDRNVGTGNYLSPCRQITACAQCRRFRRLTVSMPCGSIQSR